MQPPNDPFSTYLCSYCNGMYSAPKDSVDRTRPSRCPTCVLGDTTLSVPPISVTP